MEKTAKRTANLSALNVSTLTIATEQNDATATVTPVILPIAKTILPTRRN